ncbi:MAG: hypothetical protein J5829_10870 [Lachnospiraceae bacterium]|nr:hypothetical protein [Lachnospiraceae bacterium]
MDEWNAKPICKSVWLVKTKKKGIRLKYEAVVLASKCPAKVFTVSSGTPLSQSAEMAYLLLS